MSGAVVFMTHLEPHPSSPRCFMPPDMQMYRMRAGLVKHSAHGFVPPRPCWWMTAIAGPICLVNAFHSMPTISKCGWFTGSSSL